jgi:hypothetical protein
LPCSLAIITTKAIGAEKKEKAEQAEEGRKK